jgi:hypothetical protein
MTEPWCDMSDLPTSQCGLPCCKPPPPKERRPSGFRRGSDGPVIEATTYSNCDECGDRITPGQRITKPAGYDYWIHEECRA